MITRPREKISGELLTGCLREQLCNVGRLARLQAYYRGHQSIQNRERSAGLPNIRLSHAYPRYISTMASGYLIGSPVRYEAEDQQEALSAVLRAYAASAVDSVDAELARTASICGKGVELLYGNEAAQPRTACMDVRHAFVVYDDSVEHRPFFGMSDMPLRLPNGRFAGYRVQVFTETQVLTYHMSSLQDDVPDEPERTEAHFFGCVPLIEYWNDEEERGDFEDVMSLIDAYNLLQSDRMNDKQQFVDALLVLYGCTLETDERGRTPGRQLREDKALSLPDSDARAEWLCKQLSEADAEILREAIRSDIHKMSMVPDLTDAQFAGNASGVAMKYKLLGLEQLTKIKERWFREGLRQRLRGFANYLAFGGAKKLDADGVRMIFSRSLPVNELESAQTLQALQEILPGEELQRRAMGMTGMS